jgi:hypothetical protein
LIFDGASFNGYVFAMEDKICSPGSAIKRRNKSAFQYYLQYVSNNHFSVPFFLDRLATARITGESSDIQPEAFESDIVNATARCAKLLGFPLLSVRPSEASP